jgi:hypothetical protein
MTYMPKFIDENGGGPGVRLRKRQRAKKPKQGRAENPRFTKGPATLGAGSLLAA